MYTELSLSAQTAYGELFDQVQSFEMQRYLNVAGGSFHKRTIKGSDYWYFGYRDIDGKGKMVYVGPDSDRVVGLIESFDANKGNKLSIPQSQAALALGCTPTTNKHFKIIKRLSDYGLFRAGGILIGTHAFLTYGNMLGVKWQSGNRTMDVDFAHAGKNISVALPANIRIDAHSAIESLEMGFLPINQLNGQVGAQYRNPKDEELRLDFLTSETRAGQPVLISSLNLKLQPLKFMEFSLSNTIQTCLISNLGACRVNVPAPERFCIHKLIVYAERPIEERTKSNKDLMQAASLCKYFLDMGQEHRVIAAYEEAANKGKGWKKRLEQGVLAMIEKEPDLAKLFVI
ncbi:MAG: GSU2403 family nucleotidyltransferase fold protein [Limnobacter sp.]|nr:GSU2403 family nucleotidyltransferase fold protein [Limnobacter sp.]